MTAHLIGAFERVEGGYEGFCWAPDRAGERLLVDIFHDDVLITSVLASRFSSALRDQHIGDGKAAFRIADRLLPDLSGVVEARERNSQQPIGRHVLSERFDDARLLALEDELAAVEERIDNLIRVAAHRDRSNVCSLGVEGQHGNPRFRISAGSPAERADKHAISTKTDVPQYSVIVLAGFETELLRSFLSASNAYMESANIEIHVVDPNANPDVAKLCTSRGLRYASAVSGRGRLSQINQVAQLACGKWLAIVEGDSFSAEEQERMLVLNPHVRISARSEHILASSGSISPLDTVTQLFRGIRIIVSRSAYLTAGGMNPDLEGAYDLADCDLALRVAYLER